MGVRSERRLAHLCQQLAEGGIAPQLRPQHQRVDEEADEALRLRSRAVGDGRAHAHVVLPRVAGQHRLERRQQHHEGRRALAMCQHRHRIPQHPRPPEVAALALEPPHRRAWLVRGQLQRGRSTLKLASPERELSVQHVALQPLALPHRMIRVLKRQLRKRRRPLLDARVVQRAHLPDEDVHGPAVGHDVVHHQHQHVLLLRQLQQRSPQQRALLQRERALGLVRNEACYLRGSLDLGKAGEVLGLQTHLCRWRDDLDGSALPDVEGRAKRLVPEDQLLEGSLQCMDVHRPRQLHGRGDVVGVAPGFELIQEPQPLLREGQRQGARARHALQRGGLEAWCGGQRGVKTRGEQLHGGCFEDVPQRQLHLQLLPHTRDQLCGQQRVPAQLEEVAVQADRLHLEHFLEDGRQLPLCLRSRRLVALRTRSLRFRLRQGLAVHLASRRQRQRVQHHVHRRHHVFRQPLLQVRAQAGGLQRRPLLCRHVRHQPLALRALSSRHHHRRVDSRVRRQRRLHLTHFHPEAAHLHLPVAPAHKLQRPVPHPPHHVSRAVQPLSVSEGTGHEALRRQLRPAHVPSGKALSSHVQLSRHSHRHRPQLPVQHVRRRVLYRPPNGHRRAQLLWRLHPVAGGEGGVLRRAIRMDERASSLEPLPGAGHVHDFAASQHLSHPRHRLGLARLHLLEEGRRRPEGGDAVLPQCPPQLLQRHRARRVHHQLRPVQQCAPYLERRRVEGDGRQLQPHLVRPEVRVLRPQHQPRHRALRRSHSLGPTRAPRREHHVRQVVSAHPRRKRTLRLASDGGPLGVHAHHHLTALRYLLRQPLLRHQQGNAGLALHPGQPLQGVVGIQGDVHTSGLEDAQHAHHQLQ